MLYIRPDSQRVVSIKPEAKDGCQSSLYQVLDELLDIKNYLMVDSRYTEVKVPTYPSLGISESFTSLSDPSSKHPTYYYQKSINKFLGVIRLLNEILYGAKGINQDFTVFLQRIFYEKTSISYLYGLNGVPVNEELERLSKLVSKATDQTFLGYIRRDYLDFTLFWEKILPLINFDKITGEWSLSDFEALSGKLNQPKIITLADNNARVLRLANEAPRFMVE